MRNSGGMINSARFFPTASCAVHPNMRSARAFHAMTSPDSSMLTTPSCAVSIMRSRRSFISRRESSTLRRSTISISRRSLAMNRSSTSCSAGLLPSRFMLASGARRQRRGLRLGPELRVRIEHVERHATGRSPARCARARASARARAARRTSARSCRSRGSCCWRSWRRAGISPPPPARAAGACCAW